MAQLRLTLVAAVTLCLCVCVCADASAARVSASAASHHPRRLAHKTTAQARAQRAARKARAARCRRYARKHPHAHAHCAQAHHAASHRHSSAKRGKRRSAPARAGSCEGADEMPTEENLDAIRTATLCLINQERSAHGERALQPNADLEQAAQQHASDMARDDYFEHVGPQGDTPVSRIRASGYIYSSRVGYVVGENIAWGTLSLATPRATVRAWIASPPHLANILDARYRDSAIGVSPHAPSGLAHGQAGAIYSQDFGVIITG